MTEQASDLEESVKADVFLMGSFQYTEEANDIDLILIYKEKREPLNDSQFIEYLYNRAYSILYLLRLKS